jgi:hypothetical protein
VVFLFVVGCDFFARGLDLFILKRIMFKLKGGWIGFFLILPRNYKSNGKENEVNGVFCLSVFMWLLPIADR